MALNASLSLFEFLLVFFCVQSYLNCHLVCNSSNNYLKKNILWDLFKKYALIARYFFWASQTTTTQIRDIFHLWGCKRFKSYFGSMTLMRMIVVACFFGYVVNCSAHSLRAFVADKHLKPPEPQVSNQLTVSCPKDDTLSEGIF